MVLTTGKRLLAWVAKDSTFCGSPPREITPIVLENPASAWLTDPSQYNVLKINVVSGSGTTGYLSAGTSIDALDLLS